MCLKEGRNEAEVVINFVVVIFTMIIIEHLKVDLENQH